MSADLNLLFGVLALQMELIDPQQFADVCAGWATRKDAKLADLLIERGWITASEQEEVDRLLQRKLGKHQGDARVALSTLADYDVRDVIRDVEDEQVQESLSELDPAPGGVELLDTMDTLPEERSHHELYGDYKEGGLGRVWRARDKSLNREVALKEIRPDRQASDKALRRFMIEAQITSQLDHPNIVPVYELVKREDGQPFYTMRFIRGQTLGDAIDVFHSIRKAGRPVDRKLRDLLNAFLDVCNAIAFANARGVIHRDLKPANVVLGRHGEVAVLDWGLLKLVDRDMDQHGEDGLSMVEVSDDLHREQTIPGATMGTYQYMAPEQADGDLKRIDRRTDVYGLGAILFRILTGRAPHSSRGKSSMEVLQHIANEPSPQVSDFAHWAPKQLAAICSKAMSKERRDRYTSAEDLAEDVRLWLADEPTSVYPEPWTHRAARWMRRHRSATVTMVLAMAIVTIVSGVAAFWVSAALQAEKIARQDAVVAQAKEEHAKRDAVEWFQKSVDAVDTMLTGVGDALRYYPAQPMRRELLNQAADYYRELAEREVVDVQLRAEGGRARVRLGNVHLLLDEIDNAVVAYQEALNVFRDVTAMADSEIDVRLDCAVCLNRLGVAFRDAGDYGESERALQEALDVLNELPEAEEVVHLKAQVLINLGLLDERMLRLEESEQRLRQASEIMHGLIETGQNDDRYAQDMALATSVHGEVLVQLGRSQDAVEPLEDAVESYLDLLGQDRTNPVQIDHWGFSCIILANAHRALGHPAEALMSIRQGVDAYSQLTEAMPSVPRFVENQAVARTILGRLLHSVGQNHEAADELQQAAEGMERLLQGENPLIGQWEAASQLRTSLALVLMDLEQDEQAEAAFQRALADWEQVQSEPLRYERGIGFTRRNLGRLLHRQGDLDAARREYDAARASFERALVIDSADLPARDGLALCFEHLGDLAVDHDPPESGAEFYAEAMKQRALLPVEPEYNSKRVGLLLKTGDAADQRLALGMAIQLTQESPGNVDYQTTLGAANHQAGDFQAAIAALTDITDATITGKTKPHHRFWLAIALASRNQAGDIKKAKQHFDIAVQRRQSECPGDLDVTQLHQKAEKAIQAE